MKKFMSRGWFTCVFVCLSCFLISEKLSAEVNGGDEVRTVTLNMWNVSLKEILTEIEKQAGVTFSYESSLLKEFQKTSFKVNDAALDDCLARLFAGYPFVYKRTGNIVVLKRKPRQVTISGFVRDKTSAESLVGASVYEVNSLSGVAANTYGFFSLSLPVPSGSDGAPVRLQASYIGYESHLFTIPVLKQDTVLVIDLQPNAAIGEVLVTALETTRQTVRSTQMGTLEVNHATIRATPTLLGEADIIRTLQLTPGVSAGTEGISGLYVRGGNSDENLFLVDGNPVYQVNHIGGFFSAFNNEAIKGMNFFKAGFPARYGGRLSSVVDVHTKEGNMKEFHGSASLGLVSGNLNLEGPIWKDRTSFNIALRRTWLDVLTAPVLAIVNKKNKKNGERINVRYAFHDLNARIDHRFSDRSRMYLSLYNGNDVLKVGSEDFAYSEYTSEYRNTIDAYMRWGNLVASAGWTYAFSNKLFGKLSGFYTRYRSKIRYKEEDVSGKEGDSGYKYSLDETTNVTGITDFGVRTSFDYRPVAAHRIRFGGDYLIHYFQPEYNRMKALDNSLPDSMQIAKTFSDDKLWAHELAAYAEDDWSISDAFRLNVGLRFSLFNIDNRTYTGIEPRVSMRWLLSPDVSLKASYSRMNQYVHLISNSFMDLPTDSWMPVTNKLKPLVSDQISLGGYYNWNQLLDFSVEGYYKRMNNLLEYKDGYSLIPSSVSWENKMASGEGRAYGVEFMVRKQTGKTTGWVGYALAWASLIPSSVSWENKMASGEGRAYGVEFMVRKQTGKTTGWVGYALAWADRQFDEINKGRRYPSRYDNRHKLNIVVMHKLSKKVELSAAWTYSSGNQFDEINKGRRYPSRYDNRHKLNIVVMHKLSKKVELSAAWTYSSGNYTTLSLENYYPSDHLHQPGERPFWGNGTGEDYYDQRNNYQLPAYHRLDVGINIYRPKKKGRMGIWNISIYNVYSRMNPILVYKGDVKEEAGSDDYGNPNVTYRNAFKSIGIFPIIPSVSYTYKF